MNRYTLPRRAACAVLFALGSLAVLAGCSSRKLAGVDAGYTTLEGRPDANSQLLAWVDVPDTGLVYEDNDPRGPDKPGTDRTDILIGRQANYGKGPGVLNLLLLDGTAASGFQFFRRANNGGLQAVAEYTIPASMKWLPAGWEMYSLTDGRPSSYTPATYVARGLLDGRVTTISPVSNEAIASGPAPQATITVRYIPAPPPNVVVAVRDSAVTWTTTPGAAGYWLDIYHFKPTASLAEAIASGTPSPVLPGSVVHVLVARFNGVGASSPMKYILGSPLPGAMVNAPLLSTQQYYARVTAVDANGRVVAWTRSRTQEQDPFFDDWVLEQGTGFYKYFPRAATPVPLVKHI